MKLSEAIKIIESRFDGTGIKILSTGEMRRIGHDEIYPQLPAGKYVIAKFGVAIPFSGDTFD